MKVLGFGFLLLIAVLVPLHAGTMTVGMEGQMDVQIGGAALTAKAPDRAAPLTLRIASTRPHGTLIHYELRYIGLVPGKYDLRDYLIRPDGTSPTDGLPLTVEISGVLPLDHRGHLVQPPETPFQRLGGYKTLLAAGVGLWALCAIPLWLTRRRSREPSVIVQEDAPSGIIDQLRPLVELARAGKLTIEGKARIERLLLAHWRERLDLGDIDPAAAIVRLREHPEAGALLRTLEDWLYRPPGTTSVDIDAALAPYATQPAAPAATAP